jgi:alcohol dehydrogenase
VRPESLVARRIPLDEAPEALVALATGSAPRGVTMITF